MLVLGWWSSHGRQWWGVGQWWWGGGVDVVAVLMLVVGARHPRRPHHPHQWSWWGGGRVIDGRGVVVTLSSRHQGCGHRHSVNSGGEGALSSSRHQCWWGPIALIALGGGGRIVDGHGVVVTLLSCRWGHGRHHGVDGGGEGAWSLSPLMLVVGARCPRCPRQRWWCGGGCVV